MADRQFKPDLTGPDETLESLLARLRATVRRPVRPKAPSGRNGLADWGSFVTSRRPPRGAGGAEAPIPNDPPPADACAPI
jgi:hypothetical protein